MPLYGWNNPQLDLQRVEKCRERILCVVWTTEFFFEVINFWDEKTMDITWFEKDLSYKMGSSKKQKEKKKDFQVCDISRYSVKNSH